MDTPARRLLQRVVKRIPRVKMRATLERWGRLTATQLLSLDFTQTTRELTEHLTDLCEVRYITQNAHFYTWPDMALSVMSV